MEGTNQAQSKTEGYKDLVHDLRKYLTNDELSDVTFLVGKEKTPFKAHRQLLAFRSDVFKTMLFGDLREGEEVSIPNTTPAIFQIFLEYIYSGSAFGLTQENCLELMILADQYNIRGLVSAAVSRIKANLSNENIIQFLVNSYDNQRECYGACLEFVDFHVHEVVVSDNYKEIPKVVLMDIFIRETLQITEKDALFAIVKWINLNEDQTAEKKALLKNFNDCIRWSLLSPEDLLQVCKPIQMLSPEIYTSVLEHKTFKRLEYYSSATTGSQHEISKNFYGDRAKARTIFVESVFLEEING